MNILGREDEVVIPIFKGRDNVHSLVLTSDGKVIASLSYVTRALLRLPGQDIDSNAGADITWNDTVSLPIEGVSKTVSVLKLKLGGDVTLPVGTYRDGELVLFDSSNPSGLTWLNNITAVVQ